MLVYSKGHPSVERRSSRRKVFFFRLSKRRRKKRERRRRSTWLHQIERDFPFHLLGKWQNGLLKHSQLIGRRIAAILPPPLSNPSPLHLSPFFLLPRDSGGVAKKKLEEKLFPFCLGLAPTWSSVGWGDSPPRFETRILKEKAYRWFPFLFPLCGIFYSPSPPFIWRRPGKLFSGRQANSTRCRHDEKYRKGGKNAALFLDKKLLPET